MVKAKVKFWNDGKGYGFLIVEETGQEVFFHVSGKNTDEDIRENDMVTCELQEGKKGLNAVNVQLA